MKVSIKSNKGFYVGDICYVLSDEIYDGIWGEAGYENGKFADPKTGLEFAVAGTAWGDGFYQGSDGTEYPVDAGVIGIVPLELVGKVDGLKNGSVHEYAGEATMEAEGGKFTFMFPDGKVVNIDTDEDDDSDDDLEWWQK